MHTSLFRFAFLLICFISLIFSSAVAQTPHQTFPQTDTLPFPLLQIPGTLVVPSSDTLPQAMSDTLAPPHHADTLSRTQRPPIQGLQTIDSATDKDLSRAAIPWYSEEQLQNPFTSQANYADTSLLNFHHYDFATRSGLFNAQKGNPGHVYRSLVFEPEMEEGTQLGQHSLYGDYLFAHNKLEYYRPRHVYTDLFYLMGAEREQLFYGKHSQKLDETFHIGFQYRVVNSPGALSRLGARNTNFYATADYLSLNKRYQALGSVVFNRMRNMESGGLENHVDFEDDEETESVILSGAESRYRDLAINLHHFYQTGFYMGADSINEGRFVNLGRINHNFSYSRTSFVFEENTKPYPFYNFEPKYPETTFDSTLVHKIENLVSWSNFPLQSQRRSFPFNFRVYLKHSINTIEQPHWPEDVLLEDSLGNPLYYYDKYNYNQLVQGIELNSDRRRFISFGGFANLTVGGYNDDDFHAGAFLKLGPEGKKYNLEGMLRFSSMEAPYFYNHFKGNYANWENNFSKMQIINLRARLNSPWVKLEGNYYQMENMVYFNQEALPVQNTSSFGFFSLGAYSDLEFGWLGLRNHILLQQSTSTQFENYPELASYHSLYFNFYLSDKALLNNMGIDFHFNTGYQAMGWMPVSRVFYAQQEHTLRDRYLVDVFWSGKIKSARLFVKYQNILGLLPDFKPRYEIPFYPIPESMFKFGVSWMFFD